MTRKWIELNDFSHGQYSVSKNIRFAAPMLTSDLFDYSDAYIVTKETTTVYDSNANNRINRELVFKNNALFRSCMLKVNNTFIDSTKELHIVISMYNLSEYSDNYSMISGSLWNYYRDEIYDNAHKNNDNICEVNNEKTTTSFE